MFTQFRNDSIRKLVVGFGNLFKSIQIDQTNTDNSKRSFTVPLMYSAKEKFIKRITEHSSITDDTRIEIGVPQMAFDLVGFSYDATRKMNKLSQKKTYNQTTHVSKSLYTETPYNFIFNLYIYTRNIEENLQIIEQILPYFSPEFIISLNMNEMNVSVDIPIILAETLLTQDYEGDFSNRRMIISTFKFIAKSYVYGPITSGPGIITPTTTITDSFGFTL